MQLPDGLRITITDVTRAGYCPSGARSWFADQGLDFRAFLNGGISAEEFLATNDAHAERVVSLKLGRRNG